MTIFIDNKEIPEEDAKKLISEPDDLKKRKIVRAWCQSYIDHKFKSEESFNKGLERNRETLESRGSIETFFKPNNYRFSTEEKYRKETLYFKEGTTTGRLRQQHEKGPLAKIDEKPKKHRFVSKKRFEFLRQWHDRDPCQLPKFCSDEQQPKDGKHHIEFAPWHESGGTVVINRQHLDRRIASALENILGIR
jgi:hypothetical protein